MKALIIEDDPMLRRLLKRLLTRFRFEGILEAGDGEEGLAAAERERPAVIFCDIFMPKLDGIGFVERLRAMPELMDIPVVAISAANDRDVVLRMVDLKIADYIIKPIELEATFKRLEKLLPTLLALGKGMRK